MKPLLALTVLFFSTTAFAQSKPIEDEAQENREWLLVQMHLANNYNERQFLAAEKKLSRMTPSQLRVLRQVAETKLDRGESLSQSRPGVARTARTPVDCATGNCTGRQPRFQVYRGEVYPAHYRVGYGIAGPCVREPVWQYRNGRWIYAY